MMERKVGVESRVLEVFRRRRDRGRWFTFETKKILDFRVYEWEENTEGKVDGT